MNKNKIFQGKIQIRILSNTLVLQILNKINSKQKYHKQNIIKKFVYFLKINNSHNLLI